MNDWWKAPVLQGTENDYGDYDYMIEEHPHDYAKWEFDKYAWRCDNCGKDSHLLFRSVSHFYTMDGYDSMDYTECWKCRLKDKMHSIKYNIKRKIKKEIQTVKDALEFKRTCSVGNFIYWYKIVKKIKKEA